MICLATCYLLGAALLSVAALGRAFLLFVLLLDYYPYSFKLTSFIFFVGFLLTFLTAANSHAIQNTGGYICSFCNLLYAPYLPLSRLFIDFFKKFSDRPVFSPFSTQQNGYFVEYA